MKKDFFIVLAALMLVYSSAFAQEAEVTATDAFSFEIDSIVEVFTWASTYDEVKETVEAAAGDYLFVSYDEDISCKNITVTVINEDFELFSYTFSFDYFTGELLEIVSNFILNSNDRANAMYENAVAKYSNYEGSDAPEVILQTAKTFDTSAVFVTEDSAILVGLTDGGDNYGAFDARYVKLANE